MIKCGKCGDYHETIAEVRKCHGAEEATPWPPSDKQIAYVIGLQEQRDLPDEYELLTEEAMKRMDRAQVSRAIEELKALPYKAPKGRSAPPDKTKAQAIPPGYYALQNPEDGIWLFFEINQGKGRWDGYTFIKRLIGAPGQYNKVAVPAETRNGLIARIADDPKKAAVDYGLNSGHCGLCHSPLSDPESLARGLGPVCAKKHGW